MRNLLIAAILLTPTIALASDEVRKQNVQACLDQAEARYAHAWADVCHSRPGGTFTNAAACDLPALVADRLTQGLDRSRAYCFQANGAGLFE